MAMPLLVISKKLTITDITTQKCEIPSEILKYITLRNGQHAIQLMAADKWEKEWELNYYTRPRGRKCPVFTTGWRQFVEAKRLQVSDELIFSGKQVAAAAHGEPEVRYMIEVKRPSPVTFNGEPVTLDVETWSAWPDQIAAADHGDPEMRYMIEVKRPSPVTFNGEPVTLDVETWSAWPDQVAAADHGEPEMQYMIEVKRPSPVTFNGEPVTLDVETWSAWPDQVAAADHGEPEMQYMIEVKRPSPVTFNGEPVTLDVEYLA